MFAPTKFLHRQNVGIAKILASRKYWRRQNVGACAEASLYYYALAASAAADLSQTSLMFSYFAQNVLAALLLWADYILHCTGL
jgi:hypothetical protein